MGRSRIWGVVLLAGVLSIAASCGGDDASSSSDKVSSTGASDATAPASGSTKSPTITAPADVDPWYATPGVLGMVIGDSGIFACPAGGVPGTVWGVDTYTDDSSICGAAVYEGLLTTEDGGVVEFEVTAGLEAYEGDEANGIVTQSYAAWDASFEFVD